ncbi:MAG: septum formation protein [Kiritimatiellia bacterium]|jgi:septum formation protein
MLPLILASSSPYRREVLAKLGIAFSCHSPDIDESAQRNETPVQLVERLALEKAQAVATENPHALIIGSDQIAVLDNNIITKPHNHDNATKQLQASSGKKVAFLTSLCLLNSHTGQHQITVAPYSVEFLTLSDAQIGSYLHKEQPYNCAGSFKSEGLGITLFKRLKGDDPNSLIGLPLIQLTKMLRNEGVEPLS